MHTTYTSIEQIKKYVQLFTTCYETCKEESQSDKHFIPLLVKAGGIQM